MAGVTESGVSIGWAWTLLAAIGWSAFDVARKRLVASMAPVPLTAALGFAQAPLFAAWALAAGDPPLDPAAYALPGSVVLVANTAACLLFFWSLAQADLGRAIPMLSLTPAWSVVIAAVWLDERPSSSALAGIALVVAAAALLAFRPGRGPGRWDRGVVGMAGVALLWAITSVGDKAALAVVPGGTHAAVQTIALALLLSAWLASRGGLASLRPPAASLRTFALGTVVSVAALGCQLAALGSLQVGVMEAGKRAFGVVAAVALGRWLFHERPGRREWLAAALMVPGVVLLTA
ncbi:MAG: hypothetical protein RIT45_3332 [Pseudomonadota bacterium]|jgi:drug/metabolite transporter (DMT)-like permease